MCLQVGVKIHKTPIEGPKLVWKAFEQNAISKKLQSPTCSGKPLKEGVWLKAGKKIDPCHNYELGFHCFTTREGAEQYLRNFHGNVVRQVLVKDVVASGYQDTIFKINKTPSVVARQMLIIPL